MSSNIILLRRVMFDPVTTKFREGARAREDQRKKEREDQKGSCVSNDQIKYKKRIE